MYTFEATYRLTLECRWLIQGPVAVGGMDLRDMAFTQIVTETTRDQITISIDMIISNKAEKMSGIVGHGEG